MFYDVRAIDGDSVEFTDIVDELCTHGIENVRTDAVVVSAVLMLDPDRTLKNRGDLPIGAAQIMDNLDRLAVCSQGGSRR